MRRRGLSVTRIGRTFRNLPPASVYKFVKQPAQ
jgi:phospholipid N-methyltransferase